MRVRARVSIMLVLASTFVLGGCPKEEKKEDKSASDKGDKSSKDDKKKKQSDDDDDDDDKKPAKKKKGDDDDDDDDKKPAKKKKGDDDDDDDDDKKPAKKKTGDDDDDDDDDAPTSGKKGGGDGEGKKGGTEEPPAAAENLFAGKYSSNWGTTVFKQDGTKVTGAYPGGTLSCTVVKEVSLGCQWFEGGSSGRAFLTRNATSGVLAGAWGSGTSSNDGGSWVFSPIK